mmetsp:Transcript_21974/g.56093  ORF Transcript_21974/g.56093 Transcript_21974/m.56093 type:complete len:325 (+) Transcript_21974:131-1105(+)
MPYSPDSPSSLEPALVCGGPALPSAAQHNAPRCQAPPLARGPAVPFCPPSATQHRAHMRHIHTTRHAAELAPARTHRTSAPHAPSGQPRSQQAARRLLAADTSAPLARAVEAGLLHALLELLALLFHAARALALKAVVLQERRAALLTVLLDVRVGDRDLLAISNVLERGDGQIAGGTHHDRRVRRAVVVVPAHQHRQRAANTYATPRDLTCVRTHLVDQVHGSTGGQPRELREALDLIGWQVARVPLQRAQQRHRLLDVAPLSRARGGASRLVPEEHAQDRRVTLLGTVGRCLEESALRVVPLHAPVARASLAHAHLLAPLAV